MKLRCKIIEHPVKPGVENFQIFKTPKYLDENHGFSENLRSQKFSTML